MSKTQKSPRRKEKKSEMLDVRLPFGMKQSLIQAARRNGQTVSDAVRDMIDVYIADTDAAELKPERGFIPMTVKRHPVKIFGLAGSSLAALLTVLAAPSMAQSDKDAQPIQPPEVTYPADMLAIGASADCVATFDVTEEGYPENISVNCSRDGFDSAVSTAIWALRFEPKIVDGEAVARTGVEYPMWFQLSPEQ